jgi:hypothetical protein
MRRESTNARDLRGEPEGVASSVGEMRAKDN